MGATIGEVFKRNFRLIVEPFALLILFFGLVVWLYFASSPIILETSLGRLRNPVVVEEESARLSSLGSFLSALFQGNVGYSFYTRRPVWSDLMAGLGITVPLIVLSIVISIITGVIFGSIALKFEPKSRRPLTFAHSQRGFFFGLTVMTGFVLLVLFSLSLGWFPWGHTIPAEWLLYPPENIFVEIAGRLRHLALPAFTLTVVFAIRSFLIVWSGGSPVTSKGTLKRLLLPFTTADFACIISAVILVEWTFWLPGVGFLFSRGFSEADLPMMVGAFIVLLAIAVILGYVSVLLDFVQRLFGFHEDLDKKFATEFGTQKISSRPPGHTSLRRAVWRVFERKSLMVGSVIVISFLMIAAFAPFLTPYDPITLPSYPTIPPIADRYAKPFWYKYLPGADPASDNLQAVRQPGFDTATSLEEFNFTTTLDQSVSEHFVSDIGYEEDGCVAIVFEREEAEAPFGLVRARLFKEFNFPFDVPPKRFVGQMALMVNASEDVPVAVAVIIENEGSERRLDWWDQTFDTGGTRWMLPEPIIDSYLSRPWLRDRFGIEWMEDPAGTMFSEMGNYRYGLEITFNDTHRPAGEEVEATVYVDDFEFNLLGTAFGLLGTDQYGRDIFTQVLYGARNMLTATVPMAALAALVGLILGFLAGYFQNWVDNLAMVFLDTTLATPVFPFLVVVLMTPLILGIKWSMMWPITMNWASTWMLCALATKASRNAYLLRPKNQKFLGITRRDRFFNLSKDFLANFCLMMTSIALLNMSIGILGLYDPTKMSWDRILYSALLSPGGSRIWWWWAPPIVCSILFAAGFLLVGIGLDEQLQQFKED